MAKFKQHSLILASDFKQKSTKINPTSYSLQYWPCYQCSNVRINLLKIKNNCKHPQILYNRVKNICKNDLVYSDMIVFSMCANAIPNYSDGVT